MKVFCAGLALLVLAACAWIPKPVMAPLPPGLKASARPPVEGLFVHGRDSFYGEFWAYQRGMSGELFSPDSKGIGRRGDIQVLTADDPFISPPGGVPPRLVSCKPYSQNCRKMKIAGRNAICETFTVGGSFDRCVSADLGPSRGLILSMDVYGEVGRPLDSHTKVDLVIEHALIDPAVFDDPP